MQKKIFEDQATMHEAFLAGGADAIAELHAAHIADSATLEAWRQISGGRLEEGNRTLLLREQRDIIDRFYVQMLDRRQPAGSVFTYLMTLTGAPSVPGGKGYPERYPLTLGLGRLRLRFGQRLGLGLWLRLRIGLRIGILRRLRLGRGLDRRLV
jgi:hypothetical protein